MRCWIAITSEYRCHLSKGASSRGIRVQDTGVGIDLDKADELFKPLNRDLRDFLGTPSVGVWRYRIGFSHRKNVGLGLEGGRPLHQACSTVQHML